ncbi:hypothetical protein BWQ96_00810 [Gracilariopsis chorda]|uniref:Glycosyl hydrolase family 32 N-terminal domain-containing protein n=1 Tax=Gracilariopsis chorda TaxID=448386 RepID=A0A2V3J552_9FLOR|nr:hypothetical protein BWQ96_00810 [Gracilariopsis chorda]|eukprot:PXF49494.1 hypothetical protein BWQ96_00810 [Gracilariopsis chorda]
MSAAFLSLCLPRSRYLPSKASKRHGFRCEVAPPEHDVSRPVFTPAETNVGSVSAPVVHRYLSDNSDRFAMWYTYRPRNWKNTPHSPPGTLTGLIGLALSDDGLSWRRVQGPHEGAVLTQNSEEWWSFDTIHVSVGDVSIDSNSKVRADSGVYFMYYTGGDGEKVAVQGEEMQGIRMRVGLAISKDGEHFSRVEGPYPSGAVLDVGDEDDFDALLVAGPNVIQMGKEYVMHYFTFDQKQNMFVVGRAFSSDGMRFEKKGIAVKGSGNAGSFDERGVRQACVVKRGDTYVMFVETVDSISTRRIAMTESKDCQDWGSLKLVLDVGQAGKWDDAGVSHPNAVVLDNGSVLLYYVGKSRQHNVDAGRGTCIGVARSNGTDWTSFSRTVGHDLSLTSRQH